MKIRAFSLFEVSLIIMVIGLLISGYLSFMVPATQSDAFKYKLTQDRMQQVSLAIEKYIATFGRLVCPADYTLEYGTINTVTGLSFNAENLTGINCNNSIGAIPSAQLGIVPEMMLDGWNRKLTYVVFSTLCGPAGCTASTYNQNPGTLLTVNTAANASTTSNTVAYLIFSAGPAGRGAYSRSGSQVAGAAGDELENVNGDTIYISEPLSQSFQHIMFYRNKSDLTALSSDPSVKLITLATCQANSTQLANITRNIASVGINSIRSTLTATAVSNTRNNDNGVSVATTVNNGDEAVLDMMWQLQEVCYVMYPTTMPAIKACPGGATYQGNGTNDNNCVCKSGSWNNDC